jgi:hypothetical protein
VLEKIDATDYHTQWVTDGGGGASSTDLIGWQLDIWQDGDDWTVPNGIAVAGWRQSAIDSTNAVAGDALFLDTYTFDWRAGVMEFALLRVWTTLEAGYYLVHFAGDLPAGWRTIAPAFGPPADFGLEIQQRNVTSKVVLDVRIRTTAAVTASTFRMLARAMGAFGVVDVANRLQTPGTVMTDPAVGSYTDCLTSGASYLAPTSLVTVSGSATATANAVHVVNISVDTTITLPISPPTGTVCEFLRTDGATNTCTIAAGAGNGLLGTTSPFSLRGGNGVRFVFNAPNWIVESDALYGLTGIDRATSANTANTVMTRDGNARSQVADPSAAQDVATKNYVDSHTASGVSAPTPSTLMARDSAGRSQVVAPSASADIATKGYVDTATGALAPATLSINAQTASYTLVLTDAGKFVTVANASACTLTVPPNSSVAFPVGTYIEGAQTGAGQLTLTPGSGVTINAVPGLKIAAQYGAFGLVKLATDTWLAIGRLSS